jgi:hypothetical protein
MDNVSSRERTERPLARLNAAMSQHGRNGLRHAVRLRALIARHYRLGRLGLFGQSIEAQYQQHALSALWAEESPSTLTCLDNVYAACTSHSRKPGLVFSETRHRAAGRYHGGGTWLVLATRLACPHAVQICSIRCKHPLT